MQQRALEEMLVISKKELVKFDLLKELSSAPPPDGKKVGQFLQKLIYTKQNNI